MLTFVDALQMLFTPQDAKIKLLSQNVGIALRSVNVEISKEMRKRLDPAIDFGDKSKEWRADDDWQKCRVAHFCLPSLH